MSLHFAFLRAVNVGGRTVRMDELRRVFESIGCADVETFLASGNVIYRTASARAKTLEPTIESALRNALGYDVPVFIRTHAELAGIARHAPFTPAALREAVALNVALLADAPDGQSTRRVMTLKTEIDDFSVHGREVYWLCRRRQSESTCSNAVLERTLGARATVRGMNTLRRLAERFPLGANHNHPRRAR